MAHSFCVLSELIQQVALFADKDFGVRASIFLLFPLFPLLDLLLPISRWKITVGDFVIEFWHSGEADDRTVALHSFGNFDAPQLNLSGFMHCLILFDAVQCGFQFRSVVLYFFLAVHDELFVCFVPLLRVLWFVRFLVPIWYISFDKF